MKLKVECLMPKYLQLTNWLQYGIELRSQLADYHHKINTL